MAHRSLVVRASGLAVLAFCGRAHAHAVLVESSIGLEAAIVKEKVAAHLTLRFVSGIQPRESTLELVPEKGEARPLKPVFGPGSGHVALTLPPLAAGRYTLHYKVRAEDGHVTEGDVPLRVAAPE